LVSLSKSAAERFASAPAPQTGAAEEFETALRAVTGGSKAGETFHTLSQAGERCSRNREATKAKAKGSIKWFIENSGNPTFARIDRTVIDAARAKLLEVWQGHGHYYLGVAALDHAKARDSGLAGERAEVPMYRRELGERGGSAQAVQDARQLCRHSADPRALLWQPCFASRTSPAPPGTA